MKCPSCGGENPGEFRFCVKCGTPLGQAVRPATGSPNAPRTCSSCGRAMNPNAISCDICGRSMSPVPPQPMPFVVQPPGTVTFGRKAIGLGLIVVGLYFIWWGIYSVYYGASYGWEYWVAADYMDMAFSFIAGLIVMVSGLISMTRR